MKKPNRDQPTRESSNRANRPTDVVTLRIIAGELRSRRLQFPCDPRTRPMKDRTREAVMNLLGGTLEDHLAFDLFGGSGVMAFESLSRGAKHACVWEVLKTGAETIRGFAKELGLSDRLTVLHEDVLRWSNNLADNLQGLQLEPADAWVVFCCPPYSMWEEQGEQIRTAMEGWIALAPVGSLFAIELEVNTSEEWLPPLIDWDLRRYVPAKMAIGQKTGP